MVREGVISNISDRGPQFYGIIHSAKTSKPEHGAKRLNELNEHVLTKRDMTSALRVPRRINRGDIRGGSHV